MKKLPAAVAIAVTAAPCFIASASLLNSYRKHRASQKEYDIEIAARNFATATVLKMFLNDEVVSKDDFDREWQFAYMNYRAHH